MILIFGIASDNEYNLRFVRVEPLFRRNVIRLRDLHPYYCPGSLQL